MKYGATKDNVLRLVVVLPGGEVIRIGNRARKSSSGYDLVHLFVGAEGTLGLVTEATLKLVGLPANFMALRVTFPEVKNATDTVFNVMSAGFSPAAMEFLDRNVIALLNRDRNLSMEESPTLLMEFNGLSDEGLRAEMAFIEEICTENGSTFIDKGIGRTERDRLWEMRYLTFESIKRASRPSAAHHRCGCPAFLLQRDGGIHQTGSNQSARLCLRPCRRRQHSCHHDGFAC